MGLGGAENGVRRRLPAVVWSARAGAAARLLESLRRQGAEPVEVTSNLWAMARACVAAKGLMVLCDPPNLCDAAELVLALRKYAPKVRCWAFVRDAGAHGTGTLREVTDQDLVDWGAPGAAPARANAPAEAPLRPAPARPPLRLVEGAAPRPIGPSLPITAFSAQAESAADVLSADELAMLLGRNRTNGERGHTDGPGAGSAKGDQR